MKIKHLEIEAEDKKEGVIQTYLIRNNSNNQYIRLGKNETYYLLSVLNELAAAAELQLTEIEVLPGQFKDRLREKFEEWGFLDENIGTIKAGTFERIKKVRLIKFNVQKMLDIIYPIYSVFFSKSSLFVLIGMILIIIGYFSYSIANISNFDEVPIPDLTFSGFKVLLIFLFILVNTFLHEFAHAVTCVKYGGKVNSMGLMLFYFIPCFYCDVSGVYSIKDRKKRALIAASGILTNLFIGTLMLLAALILSYWNINEIIMYYMAISIIFISIYNLIPFVKLDGYWILTALSGIDNLMDKSVILAYTTFFSRKNLKNISMRPSKRRLFSVYGIISFFFHQIFWFYTFLTIQNIFGFRGVGRNIFIAAAIFVILFDFLRGVQHYYYTITNDYNRILMTIN